MKHKKLVLAVAVIAALSTAPGLLLAQPIAGGGALASLGTTEMPRVAGTIDNRATVALQGAHLALAGRLAPASQVADSTPMNHLQLVLRPSAKRSAALKQLIADQHNPTSPWFHHWLTPEQFGEAFGVADSDVAAAKAWLVSEGFTVNTVYPNRMQIDFSGTAAQVDHAFLTRENHYLVDGAERIANAGDISVPAALQDVVVGVAGLSNLRPVAQHVAPKIAHWNSSSGLFEPASGNAHSQALSFQSGARGLVPNDIAKIYNILPLRANGVTGKGITIAVVEDSDMVPGDWANFVQQFKLGGYGGTFSQVNPQPPVGPLPTGSTTNCTDPGNATAANESGETLLDAEWSTAVAPGANIVVASCADAGSKNFFGGVFTAALNLINAGSNRPDIISASYGYGESFTDAASKGAIDHMWGQADAEGISVFVSTGDSGANPSFNGAVINGVGVGANSLATSPHVTGVGGTDLADVLDKTSSQYFAKQANAAYGSVLSYVPEIPWNESCGNGVAALSRGWPGVLALCEAQLKAHQDGSTVLSEGGSGGPSSVDAKPAWQAAVHGSARDNSRDLPDVSLFAGSYGGHTWVVTCTAANPCTSGWSGQISLSGGTSLASPMFAGIQALIDQGMAMRGQPKDQGNAAPTLYALATQEYGKLGVVGPASLAACSADNGTQGTANCVFHSITRGSISTNCATFPAADGGNGQPTPDCYIYGSIPDGKGNQIQVGLTSLDSSSYSAKVKAYGAHPGWNFATGLGSVDARNLLIAWRAYANASGGGTSN